MNNTSLELSAVVVVLATEVVVSSIRSLGEALLTSCVDGDARPSFTGCSVRARAVRLDNQAI